MDTETESSLLRDMQNGFVLLKAPAPGAWRHFTICFTLSYIIVATAIALAIFIWALSSSTSFMAIVSNVWWAILAAALAACLALVVFPKMIRYVDRQHQQLWIP